VLLTVCTLALLGGSPSRWVVALTAILWAVLLAQLLGLRPALDRRRHADHQGCDPATVVAASLLHRLWKG
jgi:hypothetical protein